MKDGFVIPLTRRQLVEIYYEGERATINFIESLYETIVDFEQNYDSRVQRLVEAVDQTNTRLLKQITKLKAENTELFHQNYELREKIAAFEAASVERDSHNSHLPPSSDRPEKKRPKSLRRPSGKSVGGQIGHRGVTRAMVEQPDCVVTHAARACEGCGASLDDGYIVDCERRQVIDLPPIVPVVTEDGGLKKRCGTCGEVTKAKFPKGVKAAVQYGAGVRGCAVYLTKYQFVPYKRAAELMGELLGCPVSPGSLRNMVRESSAQMLIPEIEIKNAIKRAAVVHADETGLRVAAKGQYVHVASTPEWTHYAVDERRGKDAMDEIGILPAVRGNLVHDGWFSYGYYYQCQHGACNVHLLRDLTYIEESNPHQKGVWAGPMGELLLKIKARVDEARDEGQTRLSDEEQAAYFTKYDEILQRGLKLNPPRTKQTVQAEVQDDLAEAKNQQQDKRRPGRTAQTEARKLVARLERQREEVLRFMTDFTVPFDNNLAERDIRMIKLAQKIGGSFRTTKGAEEFCRIRSVISTARKQQQPILALLQRTAAGRMISFHDQRPAPSNVAPVPDVAPDG